MARRRVIASAVATIVVLGGVVAGALVLAGGASSDEGDGAGDDTATTATAEVVRRDLVEQEQLDGTLGYGDSSELSFGMQGTVTALTAEGTIVERGGILGEVDGRPIVLFNGDRPLWRPLGEGVDDGADVRVLEENLIALGYATESQLGPNETWSAATTAPVERWQDALGVEETGTVDPGHVVVTAGPVRIADHQASVGGGAGGPALSVTGTERVVTVDLDADYQSLLAADQAVEVELPDGTRTPGRVRSISNVVEPGDPQMGTNATVEVVVVLDDPAASGSLDQAPVDVHVTTAAAEGVLAVPVDALLALAEGGYAVEKVTGTGVTELVGVETGAFADGYVEVAPTTGELAEGDQVVVPA